jgi:DNA-binding NarL/FixJ family response regulator
LLVGPSQHRIRGEQFIRTLSLALANAGNECIIIAYNSFSSAKNRYEAIRAGAQDFLGLDTTASELLSLVRLAVKRDFIVDPVLLKEFGEEFGFLKTSSALEVRLSDLDSLQTDIVKCFLVGDKDLAISKQMDISRTRVTGIIEGLVKVGDFTTRNQLALALLGGGR